MSDKTSSSHTPDPLLAWAVAAWVVAIVVLVVWAALRQCGRHPSPPSPFASASPAANVDRAIAVPPASPSATLAPRPGDRIAALPVVSRSRFRVRPNAARPRAPRQAPRPLIAPPPAVQAVIEAAPAVQAAVMPIILPPDGIDHSRLGLALGTYPGLAALDIQLWRERIEGVEISLDALVNHRMVGLGPAVGERLFATGGGYLGYDGQLGLYLGVGVRF